METLKARRGAEERPRIGVDLDGVVFASFEKVRRIANRRNGTKVPYGQLTDYNIHTCMPGSTAEQISEIFNYLWLEHPEKIKLIDRSIPKTLGLLKRHFEVNITTAAGKGSEKVYPNIIRLLRHNGIDYDNLFHVRSVEEKISLGLDMYLEDDVRILRLASSRQHVILMPQPWVIEHLKNNPVDQNRELMIKPQPSDLKRLNGSLYGESAKGISILLGDNLEKAWKNIRMLMLQGLKR